MITQQNDELIYGRYYVTGVQIKPGSEGEGVNFAKEGWERQEPGVGWGGGGRGS